MKSSIYTLSAACCALAFGLTGHAQHLSVDLGLRIGPPPPVVVRSGPPRHVVERMSVSPGPGYVWVAGHHSWRNGDWVWLPGMWILPPQPSAVWVEGRFDDRNRNWIDGYWSVPVPQPTQVVEVISAPPPPRHEVRIAAPSHNHVWVDGYWAWRGHRHEWVAGHWELPPHGHGHWVAPRWERRGGNYVFIEGTWR